MTHLRLLDLFCGAGGAAMGYHRAGFDEIVGVDIKPQKRYPFNFVQADALDFLARHGADFDLIHASPPCQFATSLRSLHPNKRYSNLIPATRALLRRTGRPYVIENVAGARTHLNNPILLCGTMFGLGCASAELWRHRLFEVEPFYFLPPPCRHKCDRVRRVITVIGKSGGKSTRRATNGFSAAQRNVAMGIDWMTQTELSQAIPPAYTEWLGRRLLEAMS